jgi:site-specific DNA-methyltransferase (cytosine-N4-specific)
LLDKEEHLTDLGKELLSLQNNESEMYKRFTRHILLNLNGLNLVQCVLDIQSSGESVDLQKLRNWLHERGIHFPRGGKHPSMMRLWLEKAGVFWNNDKETVLRIDGGKTRNSFEKIDI